MGYYDALEDNIPIERDKKGFNIFYPPCRVCGAPVYSWRYLKDAQYVCQECRQLLVDKYNNEEVSVDKQTGRFNQAIKRISKVTSINPYEKAISIVSKKLHKKGWFQSTEEIMVALELIRRSVTAHHQTRIYDYYVDFTLPQYKVALEIDGAIFHGKEKLRQQQLRDEAIVYKLGSDWEVIRISTDNINTNITKLIPAIKAVLANRKNR
jgi:very-short-patch-repair endonuclease